MKVDYSNYKLEKTLIDDRTIKKVYGRLADRIIDVLDELDVAENLGQIPEAPPDRRHKMSGEMYTWSIDLNKNYRMWVQSYGEDNPDLVESIVIRKIFDDH